MNEKTYVVSWMSINEDDWLGDFGIVKFLYHWEKAARYWLLKSIIYFWLTDQDDLPVFWLWLNWISWETLIQLIKKRLTHVQDDWRYIEFNHYNFFYAFAYDEII